MSSSDSEFSYDSELVALKRRIWFWQKYLQYVENGMLDFDERVESYIGCVHRTVQHLAHLSFRSHIESLKSTSAVAKGDSDDDDDDTNEESPRRPKPRQVRYCGFIMQRARKRARRL